MDNSKKLVALGFIVLFAILLFNGVLRYPLSFLYDHDLVHFDLWPVLRWWYVISYLTQIAAALLIAFACKGKTAAIPIIGACAFALVTTTYLIEILPFDTSWLDIRDTTQHIMELIWVAGLLLLAWGSKLWTPSKIILSCVTLLIIILDFVSLKLQPFRTAYYDYDYLDYDWDTVNMLEKIEKAVSICIPLCLAAGLILTIIWACKKPKPQSSLDTFNYDYI